MKRNIKITNTVKESRNHFQKVNLYPETASRFDGHLATYAENVYFAGREALTKGGKFYNMFAAGDGHELEDYTDKNGVFHLAHAKSIFSSSMLAYNFFHWICPEHPFTLNSVAYDKVYFEVKFPVFPRSNHPSNMDVVLISDDCKAMLCIESKYTEHTHKQKAEFTDAYFKPSCYYKGNPYCASFVQMALRYNEKNNGYYAGIKQNISHIIGLTNIMHDERALKWFKTHNPFIEPEVMDKLCAETEIIFTNLLYFRPEMEGDIYGNIQAGENEEKAYPYLLGELLFEHLQKEMDEPLLLSRFIITYNDLFKEVKSQMQKPLSDYLDNRYVLTMPPHFPLPDGYMSSDHYLKHLVMEQLKRPDNFCDDEFGNFLLKAKTSIQHLELLDEKERNQLADKILFVFAYTCVKEELSYIEKTGLADRYLMIWDYVQAVRNKGFIVGCDRNLNADNYVAYCLGITNIEPDHAGVQVEKLSLPWIKLSAKGVRFTKEYLLGKYGSAYFPRLKSGNYNFNMLNFRYNYHIDLIECAITSIGSKDKIDPSVLQASDSEIEIWLEQHYPREYQLATSKAKENYKLVYNIL